MIAGMAAVEFHRFAIPFLVEYGGSMATKKKVIDAGALQYQRVVRQAGNTRSFIDEGGITRHRMAANDSPDDRIAMTVGTAMQVREVFEKFGFPGTPTTWREFRAAQIYITEAEAGVEIVMTGLDDCGPQIQLDFLQTYYGPYIQTAVRMLDGDWDDVVAYHRANGVYERIVATYDEFQDYPE
jgi:hypothetical protein